MFSKENTMEMFKNYPYLEGLIKEHKLENLLHRLVWHDIKDDAIPLAFSMILETYEDLTSDNVPRILEGRKKTFRDYVYIGNQLHAFAKEQGRHELNLSNEDVTRLFAKVELGGAKYCTKENPQTF